MFIKSSSARIVSPDEHRKLIANLKRTKNSERMYLLYLLIRYTGLRISEALSVTVGDVFDGYDIKRELTVQCSKKRNTVKNRTVSLCSKNDKLRDEIRKFLFPPVDGGTKGGLRSAMDTSAPLFRTTTGNRWDRVNASHELTKLITAAGVKLFSFHDLRHTYGTELYDLTKDMELVQAALGHEDTRTTRGYVQRPLASLHQVNVTLAA